MKLVATCMVDSVHEFCWQARSAET